MEIPSNIIIDIISKELIIFLNPPTQQNPKIANTVVNEKHIHKIYLLFLISEPNYYILFVFLSYDNALFNNSY